MTTIPDYIEWYEIPNFLAGKRKKLTSFGNIVSQAPPVISNIGRKFKGDSRAAARKGKNYVAPAPVKGKKK